MFYHGKTHWDLPVVFYSAGAWNHGWMSYSTIICFCQFKWKGLKCTGEISSQHFYPPVNAIEFYGKL